MILLPPGAIGPRSGPGAGKKAGYGSGKQTLRLKANGTAAIEDVDNSRTLAEENINKLLETFMGINDSELGIYPHLSIYFFLVMCRKYLHYTTLAKCSVYISQSRI